MTDEFHPWTSALPPDLHADGLLDALARTCCDGVFLTRAADAVVVEVSDALLGLTAHRRADVLGRSAVEFGLLPSQAARGAETRAFCGPLRTRSGAVLPAEYRCTGVRAGSGGYLLIAVQDVSEQRQATEALRRTEARYRDLFNGAVTGIAHVRPDGTFLEVNPAWARVLGYAGPEQYVAEVVSAVNIYENPADRAQFVAAIAEEGSIHGFETRLRHRDGRTVWVAMDGRADYDAQGRLVGVYASGLDVTERKRAEQALRASEEGLRSIFTHSLDGIVVTSSDGAVLAANPAACQLLDRTEAQLRALGTAAVAEIGGDALREALCAPGGRGPAHAEVRLRRPDESDFSAEVTCSRFTDADGVPRASIIIRDVSDRWAADRELRRAKGEADDANRAKNDFLSRMSHELRTPLNAILGFAQLLAMDLTGEQQASIQQIRRAGGHLLNLINEVLDISRIEAGQLSLSAEPIGVEDLLREAISLMSPAASAARVSVTTGCGTANRHYVRADHQRMLQVMLNLLSNAVKYNQPNGLVVVTCDDDGAGNLRIAVRDTGIGISAADRAALFTPFARGAAAASGIEGTGVGLALSLRLARAMDGEITVDSVVGQGSTFTLVLPLLAVRPGDSGEIQTTGIPEGQAWRGATRRADLLCIEDNPANIRLLQEIVRRRPRWELTHAGTGRGGLDQAAASPPDLILLDLHLPDMAGQAVLQRLRASAATAAVPVVVVSADATPGQAERLRAAGADGYLTKPFDVGELLELLDAAAPGPEPA